MVDYQALYHIVLDASENAISAINQGDIEKAKALLMEGEQAAEEFYLASAEK